MTLPDQSDTPSLHALGKFRHRCPLCLRSIAGTHFKRHLAAHDRRGAPAGATSTVWLAFLDGRLRGGRSMTLPEKSDTAGGAADRG